MKISALTFSMSVGLPLCFPAGVKRLCSARGGRRHDGQQQHEDPHLERVALRHGARSPCTRPPS